MDKGFQEYQESIALPECTAQVLIILAKQSCEVLGWRLHFISETGIIAFTQFGVTSRNAELQLIIENETVTLSSRLIERETSDQGLNKRLVKQWIQQIQHQREHLTEDILEQATHIETRVFQTVEELRRQPVPTLKKQGFNILRFLIPGRGFVATPVCIDLNLLLFVMMILNGLHPIAPSGEDLLQWGANLRALVLQGDWWRLLSACFIHIGITHLAMNMYALLYIGLQLEPIIGAKRFITAYLMTGIMASVVSIVWHDRTISAGASGAIFGMYGVFLALLLSNLIERYTRKSLLASILIFVIYNLVSGLQAGIDNAAHIGGLLSGMLIGFLFVPGVKQQLRSGQ